MEVDKWRRRKSKGKEKKKIIKFPVDLVPSDDHGSVNTNYQSPADVGPAAVQLPRWRVKAADGQCVALISCREITFIALFRPTDLFRPICAVHWCQFDLIRFSYSCSQWQEKLNRIVPSLDNKCIALTFISCRCARNFQMESRARVQDIVAYFLESTRSSYNDLLNFYRIFNLQEFNSCNWREIKLWKKLWNWIDLGDC